MKTILVISRSFEITKFFFRIKQALKKEKYKFIFIVSEMSSYCYLKFYNIEVYILKNKKYNIKNDIKDDIKTTLEYKIGIYTKEYMEKIYLSMYYLIKKIYKTNSIDYIFFWNGTTVYELPGIKFAKKYKKNTLFFEIANIPGKIFVDRKGTNANSELYDNPLVLDKYNVFLKDFYKWKDKYLSVKFNNHIVPQAKNESLKEKYFHNIRRLVNLVLGLICNNLGYSIIDIRNKMKRININDTSFNFIFNNIDYKKMKYIFFPLQVSTDSQILIHSDIGLIDAVLYAIRKAKEKNLELIIKPHPAEHNREIFNEICKLKEKHKFYFINDNTFKLIKYAKKVITINSTVGLEAKICGKEVEILGRAFYKDFTEEDLRRYILGYLVNIDYFSDEKISEEAIKELEKRMY